LRLFGAFPYKTRPDLELLELRVLDLFTDPKHIGLMVLIAIGAIIAGRIVFNMIPKHRNPVFWSLAVVILLVGALAYAGVAEAGVVVWVFIAAALIAFVMALVLA
jgi:phosphatidylserine decarboxylase